MASRSTIIYTVLLWIIYISKLCAGEWFCDNLPPNFIYLGEGADLSSFTIDRQGSLDGFIGSIVNITCSLDRTFRYPVPYHDNRTYQWADQIEIIETPSHAASDSTILNFTSRLSLWESMSFMEEGKALFGMLSESGSFSEDLMLMLGMDTLLIFQHGYTTTVNARLLPSFALKPTIYFTEICINPVQSMKGFWWEPHNFELFKNCFKSMGTHFPSAMMWGGDFFYFNAVENSYIKANGVANAQANAKADFLGILKTHGGFEGSAGSVDGAFLSASQRSIVCYGGLASKCLASTNSDQFQEWLNSIPGNPYGLSIEWTEVSAVVPNPELQQIFHDAMVTYFAFEGLKDIQSKLIVMGSILSKYANLVVDTSQCNCGGPCIVGADSLQQQVATVKAKAEKYLVVVNKILHDIEIILGNTTIDVRVNTSSSPDWLSIIDLLMPLLNPLENTILTCGSGSAGCQQLCPSNDWCKGADCCTHIPRPCAPFNCPTYCFNHFGSTSSGTCVSADVCCCTLPLCPAPTPTICIKISVPSWLLT